MASQKKLPRYEVLQPEYNLYDRASFDGPLRDLCMAEEIGVITYFSLAKGFLSGKYRSEADLGKSPRGGGVRNISTRAAFASLQRSTPSRRGMRRSRRRSRSPGSSRGRASPRRSPARRPIAQVDSLIRAVSLELSAADIAELDKASA